MKVRLEFEKPIRINECTVIADYIVQDKFPVVRFSCEAPESALSTKNWWGDAPQPLAATMSTGDCLKLNRRYYCLEGVRGSEVTLDWRYTETGGGFIRKVDQQ